jgi:hypothetical protein
MNGSADREKFSAQKATSAGMFVSCIRVRRATFSPVHMKLIRTASLVISLGSACNGETDARTAGDDLSQLLAACVHYKMEYGAFPSGKNLEVMRSLAGANPRKFTFIEWRPRPIDANGGFLDPWGIPYVISFPNADTVEVRSAGADKKLNTSDDKYLRKGAHGTEGNI